MLRQGTACESASRRRGRGSRSPRSRCRARELSRSSSRTPLQWDAGVDTPDERKLEQAIRRESYEDRHGVLLAGRGRARRGRSGSTRRRRRRVGSARRRVGMTSVRGRSNEDGTRSPAGLRSGRQRAGLRGAACRDRRTGETRRSRRKRLFERSGITGFLPPARRLAEAQAAIRRASRSPGGDPHCRAALSGAGGTGGRALGEPRFEHSGELPDSATVGMLGERAALSLGRDAAPLFFVREEMPNLVH